MYHWFPGSQLPSDATAATSYQVCFISHDQTICGVSTPFTLRSEVLRASIHSGTSDSQATAGDAAAAVMVTSAEAAHSDVLRQCITRLQDDKVGGGQAGNTCRWSYL